MSSARGKRRNITVIVDHPAHPLHPATVTNGKHAYRERFKTCFTFKMHLKAFQIVVILKYFSIFFFNNYNPPRAPLLLLSDFAAETFIACTYASPNQV